ncbi:hypothetical protein L1987_39273 [Smallanthus sonchifolius]|uniref:Uncharacterized protein n=1 Tax=Smallanthus sonchifolius TaxID=185202 RepID=A0ACB9HNA7_9ASTR|nr:hypothetical protein L1987_39273 [Smallanthus sonchifolius]
MKPLMDLASEDETLEWLLLDLAFEAKTSYRAPVIRRQNDEESVQVSAVVSQHDPKDTPVTEQQYIFEPGVTALAREIIKIMKATLPTMLTDAMKNTNVSAGTNHGVEGHAITRNDKPPARRYLLVKRTRWQRLTE